jgi:hypothetical protein
MADKNPYNIRGIHSLSQSDVKPSCVTAVNLFQHTGVNAFKCKYYKVAQAFRRSSLFVLHNGKIILFAVSIA